MCLAKAYVARDNGDEMVAENVASVKVKGNRLVVTTILRETKTLEATIESIDFANGSIVLRPAK
jgi:predicted RNA-binding protein